MNKDARIKGNICKTKPQPPLTSEFIEKIRLPNHMAGQGLKEINQLEGKKRTQQAAPVTSEDGFQKPRYEQRRENRKQRVISGKASNDRRFKGGPLKSYGNI